MDDELYPGAEPVYVPQSAPDHTYPYGQANPYGYWYPPPPRYSEPWLGWLVALTAVLGLGTMLLPWATARYPSGSDGPLVDVEVVHGYDGLLGPPSVVLYAVCVVVGAVIGLRRGAAWVSSVGLAVSAALLLFALLKSAVIQLAAGLGFGEAHRDAGFWLALVVTTALLVLSGVALRRRRPVQEPR